MKGKSIWNIWTAIKWERKSKNPNANSPLTKTHSALFILKSLLAFINLSGINLGINLTKSFEREKSHLITFFQSILAVSVEWLTIFDIVCLFHCMLSYGIVYITFCSQWGQAGGSGPRENSGHPGEDGGYAESASVRIWKVKNFFHFF